MNPKTVVSVIRDAVITLAASAIRIDVHHHAGNVSPDAPIDRNDGRIDDAVAVLHAMLGVVRPMSMPCAL